MSTIIERGQLAGAGLPAGEMTPPLRLLVYGTLALAAWLVLLVGLTALVEPTRFAIVIGPSERNLRALSGSDTRIAEIGDLSMVVQGNDPGFVRSLYANGAWLVLPSRPGGCLGVGPRFGGW